MTLTIVTCRSLARPYFGRITAHTRFVVLNARACAPRIDACGLQTAARARAPSLLHTRAYLKTRTLPIRIRIVAQRAH